MRFIYFALVFIFTTSAWADRKGRIITDLGTIELSLFADSQPITVANFIDLALGNKKYIGIDGKKTTKPFYNGLIFHRTHPDLGIFSGCAFGTGYGFPGFYIADENVKDSKFNQPFRLAMAKVLGETRAASQFFITTRPEERFNGKYVVFGEVTRGMDIVSKISNVERDITMKPKKPIHIIKIEIDGL